MLPKPGGCRKVHYLCAFHTQRIRGLRVERSHIPAVMHFVNYNGNHSEDPKGRIGSLKIFLNKMRLGPKRETMHHPNPTPETPKLRSLR